MNRLDIYVYVYMVRMTLMLIHIHMTTVKDPSTRLDGSTEEAIF